MVEIKGLPSLVKRLKRKEIAVTTEGWKLSVASQKLHATRYMADWTCAIKMADWRNIWEEMVQHEWWPFDRSATALVMLWFFDFFCYVFSRRFHLGPRECIFETTTFSPIFVHWKSLKSSIFNLSDVIKITLETNQNKKRWLLEPCFSILSHMGPLLFTLVWYMNKTTRLSRQSPECSDCLLIHIE